MQQLHLGNNLVVFRNFKKSTWTTFFLGLNIYAKSLAKENEEKECGKYICIGGSFREEVNKKCGCYGNMLIILV